MVADSRVIFRAMCDTITSVAEMMSPIWSRAMRNVKPLSCFFVIITVLCAMIIVQPTIADEPDTQDDRLDWWRDARFGLFIHWGLYAIPAGEWNGETHHGEWIMNTAQIPVDRYEQYVDQFNPVKFDADAWCEMARQAGMKYIVITSKHHDGFCLFDSEFTDYDIMSTPFERDIMKELSDAARRHDLKISWYHSILDWHHPDYLPRRAWETRPTDEADFDRYVDHLRSQVTELLTNYGDIGVMWFDGEWEATWTHEYGQPLYDLCRELQPDVIVNNRVDKGRRAMEGFTEESRYAGDYDTPEQTIPATGLPGVDWETCMTMNNHWGYNRNDLNYKSTKTLIRNLVDIVSKGGNYLLNVGPKADGTFPHESIDRLHEIGEWMDLYGESIYGTSANVFEHLDFGRCTVKQQGAGTTLYLHIFDWPSDGVLRVPGLGSEVISARLLGESPIELRAYGENGTVNVLLPPDMPNDLCSVAALEIEGEPIVYEAPKFDAPAEEFVKPLEVELVTRSDDLEIRYTLDGTMPTLASALYRAPIRIEDTTTIRARSFHNGKPVSEIVGRAYHRAQPIASVDIDDVQEGLRLESFDGDWNRLPDFRAMDAVDVEIVTGISLREPDRAEYIGRHFTGYIRVPEDNVYLFALNSDDGSRLLIHDRLVIDNDGLHSPEERVGTIALAKGLHPIAVEWFNKTGGSALDLRMGPIGARPEDVPDNAFLHSGN